MALPFSYYGQYCYTKWIRVGWALCSIDKRFFIVVVAMSAKQEGLEHQSVGYLWERRK